MYIPIYPGLQIHPLTLSHLNAPVEQEQDLEQLTPQVVLLQSVSRKHWNQCLETLNTTNVFYLNKKIYLYYLKKKKQAYIKHRFIN